MIDPTSLPLFIELDGHSFAGLRKFRGGLVGTFEGSFGYAGDLATMGWQRATRLHAGDQLRLAIAGRWPQPRNPITGQVPTGYERLTS